MPHLLYGYLRVQTPLRHLDLFKGVNTRHADHCFSGVQFKEKGFILCQSALDLCDCWHASRI